MGDLVIFLVWIVGLVLAVVVIVAQFQLFAIRRLLEALVKQAGPPTGPRCPRCGAGLDDDNECLSCSPKALAKLAATASPADPGAATKSVPGSMTTEPAPRSRGAERWIYIGLALAIFAVVAWIVLH